MEKNFKSWIINITEQNRYEGGRLALQSVDVCVSHPNQQMKQIQELKCTMYT